MALQTKSRVARKIVDRLAWELHEQLMGHSGDSKIDHVFAALIPNGVDATHPSVLCAISPEKPVLLHHFPDGSPARKFDNRWNFLAFSMYGDVIEQLEKMQLPKGTGLLAVNMFIEHCDECSRSSDNHLCEISTHRLSVVVSDRYSAGVVSERQNPPMFFEQNGGLIVEAMQNALSRTQ